ncbi:hypothetical protein B0T22DRAFT_192444 [Podospora appendiculata]|uniref:Zn(2)-C6 fungal-type domain-containing protein n=1 Tax=Podospora appendiculata TaxID=314037 RepID=A0AAE0XD99_9PEZI|nr:hypothetical protein B0T22DRAFT_192444 [Podospora appendiculata]
MSGSQSLPNYAPPPPPPPPPPLPLPLPSTNNSSNNNHTSANTQNLDPNPNPNPNLNPNSNPNPNSTLAATSALHRIPDQVQTQTQQPLEQQPQQSIPPQYHHLINLAHPGLTSLDAQAAALAAAQAAAAHHGLQALQAAITAPVQPAQLQSPVTPQYGNANESPYLCNNTPQITPSPPNPKVTRLRRACDMCSQRKVKCDEVQPCRPCRDLDVECTFQREMKRRGPPNKHAAAARAAKRPRLEPNLSPGPHNAAETLISIAGAQDNQAPLDAESIAPLSVLLLLVDDFFTYIHPLVPFPHEPTFRQSFANREDQTSREFLALLASMIGSLVASFPRSARLHLKAQHGMSMFPKAITLIERCRAVALQARGPMFYSKDEVTVYDAATSYFLGLAAGYTMQWKVCRRFMTETMTFVRELGYHKPRDLTSFGVTYHRGPSFDHVQDQIGKRIFWVMFLGVRSMVQLGAPQGEIVLPPPTPTEPYPELPVEVDDQYILPYQILEQPQNVVSLLTGFNQAIKIYMTMNGLVSVELSYGIATLPFHDQKAMLDECLQAAKQVTDDLPRELMLNLNSGWSGGDGTGLGDLGDPQQDLAGDDGLQYYPPAYPNHQPPTDMRHAIETQDERRRLQYEIQKANIYASQLATRSYYVERYLNLRDAHRQHTRAQAEQAYAADSGIGNDSKSVAAAALRAAAEHTDPIDTNMSAERELIVQNLLTVLSSISQRNMEPNGGSLINKIRQVASTLINDPPERKGPLAVKAEEPLSRFVEVLIRLEKIGPGNSSADGAMTPQDEEQELRGWSDLRDHQMRFFQSGGFLSQL